MNPIINRYNEQMPSSISEDNVTVSTPIYIRITTEQSKLILNAFREIKRQELINMGYDTSALPVAGTGIKVVDNTLPGQAPIELKLGMTEENLRLHLFSRNGMSEKLLLKLQHLTGVSLVTKEQILKSAELWVNHLFKDYEPKGTKTTSKTTTKRTSRAKDKSPSPA